MTDNHLSEPRLREPLQPIGHLTSVTSDEKVPIKPSVPGLQRHVQLSFGITGVISNEDISPNGQLTRVDVFGVAGLPVPMGQRRRRFLALGDSYTIGESVDEDQR